MAGAAAVFVALIFYNCVSVEVGDNEYLLNFLQLSLFNDDDDCETRGGVH